MMEQLELFVEEEIVTPQYVLEFLSTEGNDLIREILKIEEVKTRYFELLADVQMKDGLYVCPIPGYYGYRMFGTLHEMYTCCCVLLVDEMAKKLKIVSISR